MNPFPLSAWQGQLARDRQTWRVRPWAGRAVIVRRPGYPLLQPATLTGVITTDGCGLVTFVRVAFAPDEWRDVAVGELS